MRTWSVPESEQCRNISNKSCSEGFDRAPDVAVDLGSAVAPVDREADESDGDNEEADGEEGYELQTS